MLTLQYLLCLYAMLNCFSINRPYYPGYEEPQEHEQVADDHEEADFVPAPLPSRATVLKAKGHVIKTARKPVTKGNYINKYVVLHTLK